MKKLIMFYQKLKINTPNHIWKFRTNAISKHGVVRLFYAFLYYKMLTPYNSEIPLSAQFAGKPVFPHGIKGIFVSSGAKIGANCVIFHQVTIGSNTISGSKNLGAPKIGDNVFIGAGAKIIGGVTIGNNVRIGANCVVVSDIPANCTVVMQKPRIIEHPSKIRDNSYYSYNKLL